MAIILFAVSILLLWLAGLGLYCLLTREVKRYCIYEMIGLSFLLGTTFIAFGSLLTSFFLNGILSRVFLTTICLGLSGYGVTRALQKNKLRLSEAGQRRWKFLPILILLTQIFFVGWLGMRTTLSWDGLFNWEMKAKVFYEQGGIPKRFLQSEALAWAHVDYPPLMPLNQAWIYAWLGAANQNAGKLFCVIFYAIAVLILLSRSPDFSGARKFNYACLMFGIPLTWLGDGSATSGHADFPLAVFYLAAAKLLSEFVQTGERNRLKLLGAVSAGLVFVKQDSIVLLLILMIVLALLLVTRRISYRWNLVLLPAALLYCLWKLSMRLLSPYFGQDFQLTSDSSWQFLLARSKAVSHFFFWELLNPLHWGALWIVFFVLLGVRAGMLLLARLHNREKSWRELVQINESSLSAWILALLVLLPMSGDFLLYLFIGTSAEWLTLDYWLNSSAACLLLQISLVALLSIQELAKLPKIELSPLSHP